MAEFMHKRMHDRKNNSGSSGILIQVYLNCLFCQREDNENETNREIP